MGVCGKRSDGTRGRERKIHLKNSKKLINTFKNVKNETVMSSGGPDIWALFAFASCPSTEEEKREKEEWGENKQMKAILKAIKEPTANELDLSIGLRNGETKHTEEEEEEGIGPHAQFKEREKDGPAEK